MAKQASHPSIMKCFTSYEKRQPENLFWSLLSAGFYTKCVSHDHSGFVVRFSLCTQFLTRNLFKLSHQWDYLILIQRIVSAECILCPFEGSMFLIVLDQIQKIILYFFNTKTWDFGIRRKLIYFSDYCSESLGPKYVSFLKTLWTRNWLIYTKCVVTMLVKFTVFYGAALYTFLQFSMKTNDAIQLEKN